MCKILYLKEEVELTYHNLIPVVAQLSFSIKIIY